MKQILLTLNYPPSTNTMYATFNNRRILSAKGRDYKEEVKKEVFRQLGSIEPLKGRLRIAISLSRHDKRSYDIANFEKCAIDALKGLVFIDDAQIDELNIKRLPVSDNGYTDIIIQEIAREKKVKKRRRPSEIRLSKHLSASHLQ